MSDGVRNGGNVYAGYIDPRQSETYLSVRKILVHKMMPSEPTPSDGAIQEPSFSHVVNSVNESLDELLKNMRWRVGHLQEARALAPGASRGPVSGAQSPSDRMLARAALERGPYPARLEQYAPPPAPLPSRELALGSASVDARLPPLRQPPHGYRSEGGSHPATRRADDGGHLAPPSARSAASGVIQHDVWMSGRVARLLHELNALKDKMRPRLERGQRIHALARRLDSMQGGGQARGRCPCSITCRLWQAGPYLRSKSRAARRRRGSCPASLQTPRSEPQRKGACWLAAQAREPAPRGQICMVGATRGWHGCPQGQVRRRTRDEDKGKEVSRARGEGGGQTRGKGCWTRQRRLGGEGSRRDAGSLPTL